MLKLFLIYLKYGLTNSACLSLILFGSPKFNFQNVVILPQEVMRASILADYLIKQLIKTLFQWMFASVYTYLKT